MTVPEALRVDTDGGIKPAMCRRPRAALRPTHTLFVGRCSRGIPNFFSPISSGASSRHSPRRRLARSFFLFLWFQILVQHFRKLNFSKRFTDACCKTMFRWFFHDWIVSIATRNKSRNGRICFSYFFNGCFAAHAARDGKVKNHSCNIPIRFGFRREKVYCISPVFFTYHRVPEIFKHIPNGIPHHFFIIHY